MYAVRYKLELSGAHILRMHAQYNSHVCILLLTTLTYNVHRPQAYAVELAHGMNEYEGLHLYFAKPCGPNAYKRNEVNFDTIVLVILCDTYV